MVGIGKQLWAPLGETEPLFICAGLNLGGSVSFGGAFFGGAGLRELSFDELSLDEASFEELSDLACRPTCLWIRNRRCWKIRATRLLGVVGDVPAGALELDGGRGDHLLDLAATLGALLDHLVGELLDFFEAVTALLAFVFVKWHEFETVVRNISVSH